MSWAVGIAEAVDRVGEYLDAPARRPQRRSVRIGAERREQPLAVVAPVLLEIALFPECVERRNLEAVLSGGGSPRLIHAPQPLHLVAPLGERLAEAESG